MTYGTHYDHLIQPSEKARRNFPVVLENINISAVGPFASGVRLSGHQSIPSKGNLHGINAESPKACKVLPVPMNGTFNIVFELEFTDGVRWILKVPGSGYDGGFDALHQRALISEARTMRFLRAKTTIPVPDVYAFDASVDNELNVPFILMEKINGKPAYEGWWFDDQLSKGRLEQFRVRVLKDIAAAMVQLNQFTFDQGGSLLFDGTGEVIGTGETKFCDGIGIWDGVEEHEPTPEKPIWTAMGPLTDPKVSYLFTLDRLPGGFPVDIDIDVREKGIHRSLRLFIDWACERSGITGKKFVLSHPDLDLQNILVAEDGTVQGFIDWDGAAAVPREIGCSLYPGFLMRDWVLSRYDYQVSKNELQIYRAMYAQFMEMEIERIVGGSLAVTELGTSPRQEADITRRSLVMKNLEIAAGFPKYTREIVEYIHMQIADLTNPNDEKDEAVSSEDSDGSVHDQTLQIINTYASSADSGTCKGEPPSIDAPVVPSQQPDQTTAVSQSPKKHTASRIQKVKTSALKQPDGPHHDVSLSEVSRPSRNIRVLQHCCYWGTQGLQRVARTLYAGNRNKREPLQPLAVEGDSTDYITDTGRDRDSDDDPKTTEVHLIKDIQTSLHEEIQELSLRWQTLLEEEEEKGIIRDRANQAVAEDTEGKSCDALEQLEDESNKGSSGSRSSQSTEQTTNDTTPERENLRPEVTGSVGTQDNDLKVEDRNLKPHLKNQMAGTETMVLEEIRSANSDLGPINPMSNKLPDGKDNYSSLREDEPLQRSPCPARYTEYISKDIPSVIAKSDIEEGDDNNNTYKKDWNSPDPELHITLSEKSDAAEQSDSGCPIHENGYQSASEDGDSLNKEVSVLHIEDTAKSYVPDETYSAIDTSSSSQSDSEEDREEDTILRHSDQSGSSNSEAGDNVEECEDDGTFTLGFVIRALGRGELDEIRMLRMKIGFLKLLRQL